MGRQHLQYHSVTSSIGTSELVGTSAAMSKRHSPKKYYSKKKPKLMKMSCVGVDTSEDDNKVEYTKKNKVMNIIN
jgi:hypothetical protein